MSSDKALVFLFVRMYSRACTKGCTASNLATRVIQPPSKNIGIVTFILRALNKLMDPGGCLHKAEKSWK